MTFMQRRGGTARPVRKKTVGSPAIVIAARGLVRRELIEQDHRVAILVIMVGLSASC